MPPRHVTVDMSILAAVDVEQHPERPIEVGYDLASAFDDTLVVMYVMKEDEFQNRLENRGDLPDELQQEEYTIEQAMQGAANKVRDAVNDILGEHDAGRIDPIGRVGDPADEILFAIDQFDPRYVVVGGRKRSPTKQMLFGSVSQEIIREAERPVMTILEEE